MEVPTVRANASVSSRGLARVAAAALLIALAWPRLADAGTTVRVRIDEGAAAYEVLDAHGKRHLVRAVSNGLHVDGSGVGARHVFRAARGPYRVVEKGGPAGPVSRFRGAIAFERRQDGFDVVHHVALEDYVAGTLGGEIL